MNKRQWIITIGVNEQAWLEHAYDALAMFWPSDPSLPARVRTVLTYGFPKGRGRSGSASGATYHDVLDDGRKSVIMIHPREWTTAINVLAKLAHQMIHATCPGKRHDTKSFSVISDGLGFDPTDRASATPLPPLVEHLQSLAESLPPFPPSSFDVVRPDTQPTRNELYQCECYPRPIKVRHAGRQLNAQCLDCGSVFARIDKPTISY